jgi:hypothetical protein
MVSEVPTYNFSYIGKMKSSPYYELANWLIQSVQVLRNEATLAVSSGFAGWFPHPAFFCPVRTGTLITVCLACRVSFRDLCYN